MDPHNAVRPQQQPASVLRGGTRVLTLAHVAALMPFIVFALVYGPAAGRGFISDDFGWILESRVRHAADIPRLFVDTTGFYRPLVSISFAINERVGRMDSRVYGFVNIALAVMAALSIAWVVRLLRLPSGASWFASGIWLLNFHGINMAVLWISGRTALLLVLFSALASVAVLRKQWTLMGVLTFAAMLSKEEAILLPASLLVLAEVSDSSWRSSWPMRLRLLAPLGIAAVMYLALRTQSDSMIPSTAPHYYRFTFEPSLVGRNALEYADRAATLGLSCLLLILAIVKRRPRLGQEEKRSLIAGILWVIIGYALTVFLPVRSSLYACFPAIGAAIASASVATAFWRVAAARQRQLLLCAAAIIPVMLIPVYQSRTDRWTGLADISRTVFAELETTALHTDTILLVDDRSKRANIWSAFGSLLPDAVELATGRRQTVWLTPPPLDASPDVAEPVPPGIDAGWMLRDNALQPVDVSRWLATPAFLMK